MKGNTIMKLPYGYAQIPNGEIVINDRHAEAVQFIYQQYISGASLGKIVDCLFDKQIFSPSGNPKWARAAIDNTLKNGKYVPHIIPLSEFAEVQFQMTARSNLDDNNNMRKTTRYNSQNVLSGLLICAKCGATYRRITNPSGEVVWRCGNKVEHGKTICMNAPTISDEAIKTILREFLNMTEFDEQIVKALLRLFLSNMMVVLRHNIKSNQCKLWNIRAIQMHFTPI